MVELRQKGRYDMPQLIINFSKIAFGAQRTLDQALSAYSFEMAIKEVINPSTKLAPRYGRTWRFSQPKIHDGFLVGKFGFVTAGIGQQGDYDEELKDFILKTIDTKQPTYSLWAIDLLYQILAFEVKPPDIKYQSFVGNFEGFLNERPDVNLTIEKVVETAKFIEWVENVDRVTKFTATLRPPNPDYSKHPKDLYRELLEKTNADQAKVEFTKQKGSTDSLNTEKGKTIQTLVEYGKEGYSTIVARGLKKSG